MADNRPPVAIRIVRPYDSEDELLEHELETLGKTSVILIGAHPRPTGVILRFEVTLASGATVLRGEGRVLAHKENAYRGQPGLTLRFTRLDPRSKAVVDRATAMRDARPNPSRPPPRPDPALAEALTASTPEPADVHARARAEAEAEAEAEARALAAVEAEEAARAEAERLDAEAFAKAKADSEAQAYAVQDTVANAQALARERANAKARENAKRTSRPPSLTPPPTPVDEEPPVEEELPPSSQIEIEHHELEPRSEPEAPEGAPVPTPVTSIPGDVTEAPYRLQPPPPGVRNVPEPPPPSVRNVPAPPPPSVRTPPAAPPPIVAAPVAQPQPRPAAKGPIAAPPDRAELLSRLRERAGKIPPERVQEILAARR